MTKEFPDSRIPGARDLKNPIKQNQFKTSKEVVAYAAGAILCRLSGSEEAQKETIESLARTMCAVGLHMANGDPARAAGLLSIVGQMSDRMLHKAWIAAGGPSTHAEMKDAVAAPPAPAVADPMDDLASKITQAASLIGGEGVNVAFETSDEGMSDENRAIMDMARAVLALADGDGMKMAALLASVSVSTVMAAATNDLRAARAFFDLVKETVEGGFKAMESGKAVVPPGSIKNQYKN